jgi:hypothetical protein
MDGSGSGSGPTNGVVAFLMVVGPGEGSLAGDTLDSVAAFEPDAVVWVLDDCTKDGTYETMEEWAAAHPGTRVLRNHEPRGYRGIAASFFSLLAAAYEALSPELVVKIDPDACLIGPGFVNHVRNRLADLGPGIVGAYRLGASGARRRFDHLRRNMLLDLVPVGLHKDRRSLRFGRPFWAPYLPQARRHGYEMGEHVLGALSAMDGDTLRALYDAGFLSALPERYRALTVEEDVLLGLGAKAVGHQLIDLNTDPDQPVAWIQFRPPVPLSADQLLEKGVSAVHPVKSTPDGEAMRAVFRRCRSAIAAP